MSTAMGTNNAVFTHRVFGSDHITEAMMMVWLGTFFASMHSFVACRQYLSGMLLPSTKRFLFFFH